MKKIFIFSVILFALQNFLFSQTVRNKIQSYINKEADETLFLYNCEKISNDEKKEIYFITVGLLDETFSNNREIVKIGFIELVNGTCINQNLIDFFSIYRESEIKSLKWEKNIDSIHKNFSMGWIIKFNTISEPVIIIEKLSGLGTKLYFYTVKNDSLILLYKITDQFSSISEIELNNGLVFLSSKKDYLRWNNEKYSFERIHDK